MNILTFGMIIKDYKLEDISSYSRILMHINENLSPDIQFNCEMTGKELVEHLRNLPYDKQMIVNGIIVIPEIEEFSFYREMQMLESNGVLKEKYNNTVASGLLMGITWSVTALFILVTLIYHYNTVKNNDAIAASITHSIINLIKYAISTFI